MTWEHDEFRTTIASGTPLTALNATTTVNSRQPTQIGATFAAGVRMHAGRLGILPEVRYTRWSTSNLGSRKNEAKFLLGISF